MSVLTLRRLKRVEDGVHFWEADDPVPAGRRIKNSLGKPVAVTVDYDAAQYRGKVHVYMYLDGAQTFPNGDKTTTGRELMPEADIQLLPFTTNPPSEGMAKPRIGWILSRAHFKFPGSWDLKFRVTIGSFTIEPHPVITVNVS